MTTVSIARAAEELRKGNLVVFPTETVYGIGALAGNSKAVKKIFQAKGRPQKNPLIVHISSPRELSKLVAEIPEIAKKLMKKYWPGPLTLCFKKSSSLSHFVTAGLSTVCIRCPDHPIARALLKKVAEPLAAPSANLSGRPSATTGEDAKHHFKNRKGIFFLEGGASSLGLESTILDVSTKKPTLLRPGVISKEALEKFLGQKVIIPSSKRISSPGQLLKHYAPKGKLIVLQGSLGKRRKWITHHVRPTSKTVIGVIGKPISGYDCWILSPSEKGYQLYGKNLYRFLNWCDEKMATSIFLELSSSHSDLLPALLNRLQKASRGRIVMLP